MVVVGGLTPEQWARLQEIDVTGKINNNDKQDLPGIHFCPDWDDLAVCDQSPEMGGCNCDNAWENIE